MTTPALATRVMKARRETTCAKCRQRITVGQYIAKVAGIWIHASCAIRKETDEQPTQSRTRPLGQNPSRVEPPPTHQTA